MIQYSIVKKCDVLIIPGLNKLNFACGNLWCFIWKGFEWFLVTNMIQRAYEISVKFVALRVTSCDARTEWSIVVRLVTHWH